MCVLILIKTVFFPQYLKMVQIGTAFHILAGSVQNLVGTKSWAQNVLVANQVHMVIVEQRRHQRRMTEDTIAIPTLEALRMRTVALRPAIRGGRRSPGARARWPRPRRRSSQACAQWLGSGRRSSGARARRPGRRAPPLAGARGAEDRTERGKSGGRRCHQRHGLSPEGRWRIWRSSCPMRRR